MTERPLNTYDVQIIFAEKELKALWEVVSSKLDSVSSSQYSQSHRSAWLTGKNAISYMGSENKVIVSGTTRIGKKSFSFWKYFRTNEDLVTEMLQTIAKFDHNYGMHHLREYLKALRSMIRDAEVDYDIRERFNEYREKIKAEKEKMLAVVAKKIKLRKNRSTANFEKMFGEDKSIRLVDCDDDDNLILHFESNESWSRKISVIKIHVNDYPAFAEHFYPIAKYMFRS